MNIWSASLALFKTGHLARKPGKLMNAPTPIRVLIVDDYGMLRSGWTLFLSLFADLEFKSLLERTGLEHPAVVEERPAAQYRRVKDAVEIGGKHLSPFFFGSVDEGAPSAAADAGIGKAAVDAAERIERRLHRILH